VAAVARVDEIAHRLADQVRAQGPAPEAVALEQFPAPAGVVGLGERPADLEVVAQQASSRAP
jgi:hypothetical protein